jgi:hypothetical protein
MKTMVFSCIERFRIFRVSGVFTKMIAAFVRPQRISGFIVAVEFERFP